MIIAVLAAFMLQGCGGGGGGGTSTTVSTGILRGVIYASDGVTPVAGATVYVPSGRASTPEPAITSTVTAEDGSFTLTGVPQEIRWSRSQKTRGRRASMPLQ